MKDYKEIKDNIELEGDPVDEMFEDLFYTLKEGSGVITNSISIGMVKKLRKIYTEIKRTRDIGKKCDLLSGMMMVVGGLQLVTIGVSGDKKGLLSKGMSLLSIVTSLRSTRR